MARKELLAQYRGREIIGGVYAIRNTLGDRRLVCAVTDLQGSKNRFEFAKKTGACSDPKLRDDWEKQGGGSFVFELLEELKKGETQSDKEFETDLAVLKEMWLEKLSGTSLY